MTSAWLHRASGEVVAAGVEPGEVVEQLAAAGQDGLGVGVLAVVALQPDVEVVQLAIELLARDADALHRALVKSGDLLNLRDVSRLGLLWARSRRTPLHSEARDGPADDALAGAEIVRDLVEGHAALVETACAAHLFVGKAEPQPSTASVEVGGDGGAVDARVGAVRTGDGAGPSLL